MDAIEYVDSLVLKPKNDKDKERLQFLFLLNEKGAIEHLIDIFAELVNNGVVKIVRGKIVWNEDWEVLNDVIKGYA